MALPKHEYVSDVWKDGMFANTVVLCTGGAGTICSAQVRALVHLGASACIIGRNASKTTAAAQSIATARPNARVLPISNIDVRSPTSLASAAAQCAKELGGIDYVIAGAAGNFLAPLEKLSPNAFKSVMDIDVLGSYNTVKATLPYMRASVAKPENRIPDPSISGTGARSRTGRYIFVSATLHYTGTPLQTHVGAAKAAVDALSASLAIEQGPFGITSNVIAPGPIGGTEGMSRLSTPEDVAGVARRVPLGRMGSVRDVADATVFLCGGAGGYVNGGVVVVDGGAWRTGGVGSGGGAFKYPDFLLGGGEVEGVEGGKKEKEKAKI